MCSWHVPAFTETNVTLEPPKAAPQRFCGFLPCLLFFSFSFFSLSHTRPCFLLPALFLSRHPHFSALLPSSSLSPPSLIPPSCRFHLRAQGRDRKARVLASASLKEGRSLGGQEHGLAILKGPGIRQNSKGDHDGHLQKYWTK